MPDEDQDGAAKKRARGEEEELADGGSADAGPAKKARTEEDAAGEDQDGAAKKPQRDEEEEQADGGFSDAGPSKKARTENAAGAEVGDAATDRGPSIPTDAADATEAGPTEAAEAGAGDVKEAANEEENLSADEPKKIGYKLFKDGKEAATYFRTLLNALTQRQPLNEYEFHMVLELLKNGHPEPEKKMGSGVKAIIVRKHQTEDSNCFFLLRTDGSMDDFSVFKCINRLFPAFGKGRGSMSGENSGGTRGRGRGRGRGGRGRGRGQSRGQGGPGGREGRRGGRRG